MLLTMEQLRQIPLLAQLEPTTLAAVARRALCRSYRAGDHLMFEGDQPDGLYFVMSGRVRLARTAADGREQVLAMAGTGSMLNAVGLFDEHPTLASARAMSAVTCMVIPRTALNELIDQHPGLARAALRELASQLRGLVVLVEDLAFRSVRERLARQLLYEAEEGMAAITHQELAERTGTIREIAGRALRQMAEEGLVRLARGRVIVLDHDRLANLVDKPEYRSDPETR